MQRDNVYGYPAVPYTGREWSRAEVRGDYNNEALKDNNEALKDIKDQNAHILQTLKSLERAVAG